MSNSSVILAVDDDSAVLQAIIRDLRRRYAKDYRVVRADSGHVALQVLKKVKLRGDTLALLLVDQRMPEMTGTDFLKHAAEIFPTAKRILLTAYADTEAVIVAINDAKIDYYLLKPWDPPEQQLYPVLDDFLKDWRAAYRPSFSGIRIIGDRWSPNTHNLKDFLARNQVPYRWLDIERSKEAKDLINFSGEDHHKLPLVVFPNGSRLVQPDILQVAEEVGLNTQAEKSFYDLIIIGGGPAGLAAAVYGASEGLRTIMIEREAPGGQAGTSSRIENYLGFPIGLGGGDLARRAVTQAKRFGVEILSPQEATSIRVKDDYRIVTLADGSEVNGYSVILSLGVWWRRLDVAGVEDLTGAGIYYGAAQTEAMTCSNEEVFIVGGANSAGQGALHFSRYAKKVTMLVRGGSLAKSMSQYLVNQINSTDNINIWFQSSVVEAKGNRTLEALVIENSKTGAVKTVPASLLFIFIGAVPYTDWLDGIIARDKHGFILTGSDLPSRRNRAEGWLLERDPYLLETSVPGIFAVGDVRHGSVKRVAASVGEGSVCVQFVHRYLSDF